MDENRLIKEAQQGNLEAFNRLVLAYQDMAYNLAYRILSDQAAAEDARPECIYCRLPQYPHLPGRRFSSLVVEDGHQ